MSIYWILGLAFSSSVVCYMFCDFNNNIFEARVSPCMVRIVYFLMAILVVWINLKNIPLLNFSFILLYQILATVIFFKSKKTVAVIYSIVLIVMFSLLELITAIIFSIITGITFEEFLNKDILNFWHVVISKIVIIIIYQTILRLLKVGKSYRLPTSAFLIMLVIPVGCISVTTYMLSTNPDIFIHELGIFFLGLVAVMLSMNFLLMYLIRATLKNQEAVYENKLLLQKRKYQHDNYISLRNKYNESKRLLHDTTKLIDNLQKLYDSNGITAEDYKNELLSRIRSSSFFIDTDNEVVNVILNDKFNEADSLGIKVKPPKIENINLDFIDVLDLSVILLNIFDNAIEAARDNKDGFISFGLEMERETIVIMLANYSEYAPVINGGALKSGKGEGRGLGLINVQEALSKYYGSLSYEYENKTFSVCITIPKSKAGEI